MSTLRDLKREVYGCAVKTGVMGQSPLVRPEVLRAWEKGFYKHPTPVYSETPRLINHFKIGADPEFLFEHPPQVTRTLEGATREVRAAENRVTAQSLGMKTGLFMGADQNGRLAELRPKPNKSCLKVLASLLAEMRWGIHAYGNKLLELHWRCNPFMYADGVGGHIHFGRKRPTRPQEVDALAAVYDAVFKLSLYDNKELKDRQKGDVHGQRYGLPDDYRPQAHGYEYRAFPSWLDNPWLAYFMLVVSKLAVQDPELVRPWHNMERSNPVCLLNLLAYYKGRDDDALLAYHALKTHGMPQHLGGDFKKRWGLNYAEVPKFNIEVWPNAIKADKSTEKECFDCILLKRPLASKTPSTTWKTTKLPEGYAMVLSGVDTYRKKGLGEVIYDLCFSRKFPCTIDIAENGFLYVHEKFQESLPKGWRIKLQEMLPGCNVKTLREGKAHILVGKTWREAGNISKMRKALTSGVFPLWKADNVVSASYREWCGMAAFKKPKTLGTMIYPRAV